MVSVQHILFVLFAVTSLMAVRLRLKALAMASIGFAPRGNNGFGYDPIFFTDDNKTFAELSSIQKDAMSHRGKALRALAEKLREKLKEKKF